MATTTLNLSAVLSYALQATGVFTPVTTQPGASQNWSLSGLDLTVWNQLYLAQYVIFITAPASPAAVLASGGTLSSGTTYYYKVTGTGPYGTLITNTTESGPSTEVSATPSGGNLSITVSWTQLQGATGYKVYRGTVTSTENLLVGTITTGTTVTFTDTGFAGSSATPPAAPAAFIEFDFSSFTDQVGTVVTPTYALGLLVIPTGTGATCAVAPGTTNGFVGWFTGTTPAINPKPGGVFLVSGPIGAKTVGYVVDSTHKTIRITAGTANLTATVAIPVSTT